MPNCHPKPWKPAGLVTFALFFWPVAAFAFPFEFPAPTSQSLQKTDAMGSFALPVGPFAGGTIPTKVVEGAVVQTAWTLEAKGLTTLQILTPLRDQLQAAGYDILFECDTFACGGYDFRFGIDIAAEPAMHVDLGDFRYLSAEKTKADGPSHVSLVVSRSSALGFVQVTEIGKAAAAPAPPPPTQPAAPPPAAKPTASPMAEGLMKEGSVALDDLIFASGASDLAPGEYASLDALAEYLRANPESKIALVGHTDASGGLAGNITLSRERAASVRQRLISSYAIPQNQITAEGVGYLAPRDSNLTEDGLTRNRRVEAMLLVNP